MINYLYNKHLYILDEVYKLGKEKRKGLLFLDDIDILEKILKEEEEDGDDYLVYQPLVYPPGSTPPTPNLSRKINFVGFNLN